MALTKERMSSVRARTYTDDLPSLYGADKYPKLGIEEGHINSFDKLLTMSRSSSPLGSSDRANSNEFALEAAAHHAKEPRQPLFNFKATGTTSGHNDSSFIEADSGSLLSFKQNEDYSGWEPGSISCWDNCPSPKCSSDVHLFQDSNSFQTASNFSPMIRTRKGDHGNWLYTEATTVTDSIQEDPASHEANLQKRPYMGESLQAAKKQCNNPSPSKKTKPKVESSSKDPQSIAAKQRRERISDRLKTLQELVPNGSKVDLVTMLEKAINYVKFLQLQVKVLATDELWPVQVGKAPDISQVKEVIDAILSSQRDRNSSSSSK